jgi:hypothetical protein
VPETRLLDWSDPRPWNPEHPRGSKIEEEAPSLTPADVSQNSGSRQKKRAISEPAPDSADLECRKERSRSVPPQGVRGSRKVAPSGARRDPQSQTP